MFGANYYGPVAAVLGHHDGGTLPIVGQYIQFKLPFPCWAVLMNILVDIGSGSGEW